MKKQTSIITLLVVLFVSFSATFGQGKPAKNEPETIKVIFKNNSILPRKYTIVSYSPEQDGNSTNGVMMMPNGTKEFEVSTGTKFYLADSQQVDVVMSGNKLTGKPFYVAKAEDNGKTINLRKE